MTNQLEEKVFAYIKENSLIAEGDKILLSLSAGKDSMAMLRVLSALRGALKIGAAGIFHLNHLMRGDESDADYEFIRNIADDAGLPFYGRSFDFSSSKGSFEEHARHVRYSMLAEIKAEYGYSLIATAHNLDDNAETILMRLFQGSGLLGLRGIPQKRDGIIRPLRCCSAAEIIDYLNAAGTPWREDSSNADTRYRRNYIRRSVLPPVREAYPHCAGSIDSLCGIAARYIELVDELSTELLGKLIEAHDGGIAIASHKAGSRAGLLAHLLAEAIREYGAFASYSLIGEVLRKYSTSPRGALVLYESPSLLIEKTLLNGKEHILIGAPRARPETAEWEYGVPGTAGTINLKEAGMRLSVGCCDYDFFSRNRRKAHLLFVAVPADSRLVLRNRRPGDRIRLESGTKKIKDFFIDKKIGAEIKQRVPLLLVNSNVAAVMAGFLTAGGNRVAESALVNEKSDKILFFERSGHVF